MALRTRTLSAWCCTMARRNDALQLMRCRSRSPHSYRSSTHPAPTRMPSSALSSPPPSHLHLQRSHALLSRSKQADCVPNVWRRQPLFSSPHRFRVVTFQKQKFALMWKLSRVAVQANAISMQGKRAQFYSRFNA